MTANYKMSESKEVSMLEKRLGSKGKTKEKNERKGGGRRRRK